MGWVVEESLRSGVAGHCRMWTEITGRRLQLRHRKRGCGLKSFRVVDRNRGLLSLWVASRSRCRFVRPQFRRWRGRLQVVWWADGPESRILVISANRNSAAVLLGEKFE